MKIVQAVTPPEWTLLRSVPLDSICRLKSAVTGISQRDPLLVIDLQNYELYVNEHECETYNKVALVNLNTGRLHYMDGMRDCKTVEAEVKVL